MVKPWLLLVNLLTGITAQYVQTMHSLLYNPHKKLNWQAQKVTEKVSNVTHLKKANSYDCPVSKEFPGFSSSSDYASGPITLRRQTAMRHF